MLNEQQFNALAGEGYNRIPVTLETFADLDTPLSIYLKLANEPHTFLLESVQGGERFGRYSIIGLASPTRIEVHGRTCLLLTGNRLIERHDEADPLSFIAEFMRSVKVPPRDGLPRFAGGLVGYFGYDAVRTIEPQLASSCPPDPLGTPDSLLLLCEELAIVDNLSGKLTFVVYADPNVPGAFRRAGRRLAELLACLRDPVRIPADVCVPAVPAVSSFEEEKFKAAVRRVKQNIDDGEVSQVVLSQRMSKPFAAHPVALYRAIRSLNPSPYLFNFNFDDFHVVGASPEILVRLQDGNVTVRPIAGTRKRGATPEEDKALEEELLSDEKERDEHLQLLDLGCEDLGRIAATDSVKVTDEFVIERYSHVMHIVSNIECRLADGLDVFDVLRANFPAGTVSGAPRVRAMEIIDELEPVKRGVYAGAVGYIGFHGDMDLAISIRTAVLKDGQIHVQAGAGIVSGSTPEGEWKETQNKARGMLRAAEMAESGLDTRL